jgi:hypothetical protein
MLIQYSQVTQGFKTSDIRMNSDSIVFIRSCNNIGQLIEKFLTRRICSLVHKEHTAHKPPEKYDFKWAFQYQVAAKYFFGHKWFNFNDSMGRYTMK